MTAATTARGGHVGHSDPLGSIGWTERTGGVLTARECVTLAGPLLRGELGILAGLLAMALRVHSGRRATIEPARLAPPDSSLARDAQEAAEGLLTPVLLNHAHRAYAWAAALAVRRGIAFDRELLYLAAMFHDTGLPSPVSHVDFTISTRSRTPKTRAEDPQPQVSRGEGDADRGIRAIRAESLDPRLDTRGGDTGTSVGRQCALACEQE